MKRVKIAVIGARFGRNHIEGAIRSHNAELVCFCDKNEEYAKELSVEYKVPYVTDAEEIFKNPEIDAVTIALPDQIHAEMTIRALRAGKHVMCEKPMALKLDECKEMIRVSPVFTSVTSTPESLSSYKSLVTAPFQTNSRLGVSAKG